MWGSRDSLGDQEPLADIPMALGQGRAAGRSRESPCSARVWLTAFLDLEGTFS